MVSGVSLNINMSRQSAYSYEGGGYGVQRLLLDALKAVFSSF